MDWKAAPEKPITPFKLWKALQSFSPIENDLADIHLKVSDNIQLSPRETRYYREIQEKIGFERAEHIKTQFDWWYFSNKCPYTMQK